jgi:hypothetical protein
MTKKAAAVFVFLFLLASGFSPAYSQPETNCRKRIRELCRDNIITTAQICRFLERNSPETVPRIYQFFHEIRNLEPEVRRNLICARLVGNLTIYDVTATIDYMLPPQEGKVDFVVDDKQSKFIFKVNDPFFYQMIRAHRQVRQLKLNIPEQITFNLRGKGTRVTVNWPTGMDYGENTDVVTDVGMTVYNFEIEMENVRISDIRKQYCGRYSGQIGKCFVHSDGFERHFKIVRSIVEKEYQKYVNLGIQGDYPIGRDSRDFLNVCRPMTEYIPCGR